MAPVRGVADPAQEPPESPGRLDSWKEIAVYLGRSVRTVRRWEESEGLPVHRHLHEVSGSVYAFKAELDAWLLGRRPEPVSAARTEDSAARPDAPAAVLEAMVSDTLPSVTKSNRKLLRGRVPWLSVVTRLLLIGAVAFMAQSSHGKPPSLALPISPAADDFYLKGRHELGRTSVRGYRAAISYFEQAIAEQPDLAKAYEGLALAWVGLLYNGPIAPDQVLPKAEEAALKALALDETLRDARNVLATVRRTYGDHAGADAELARLRAQRRGGVGNNGRGNPVAAAELARERDPLSVDATLRVANAFRAAGDDDRAIAEFKRAVELEPTQPNAWFQLGVTLALQRNMKEAIPTLERAVDLSTQRNPRYLAYLGHLHAMDGRPDETRRILRELLARRTEQYVSSFGIALLHDALGEKAAALAALEQASKEHAIEFTQLNFYRPFKTLASEPRYKKLMGIPSRRPDR